jgi:membrane protease subunit (stomatin/prohibitin family)
MANELDESWKSMRGIEVQSVGIASVSYDDESKELINMRNKGAMLGDPSVREGYVQGSVARGIEAAGSNSAGAAQAFMGVGVGMNGAGGFMASASETNRRQMEAEKAALKAGEWTCSCGNVNSGKFCSECGAKKPESKGSFCTNCGAKLPAGAKFCSECGEKV